MTRQEHLAWCKKRALEYLDAGDVVNAVASMMSDMDKHPETRDQNVFLMTMALKVSMDRDIAGARRWIEGFN